MKKLINKVQLMFKTRVIEVDVEYSDDSYIFELLTEEFKSKIYQELDAMHDANELKSKRLPSDKAEVFNDKQAIAQRIFDEIDEDYKENMGESAEGGFNFRYLLTETDIEPAAISVTVEISDPEKKIGNVYYSLSVKKKNGKYYLWPFEF